MSVFFFFIIISKKYSFSILITFDKYLEVVSSNLFLLFKKHRFFRLALVFYEKENRD